MSDSGLFAAMNPVLVLLVLAVTVVFYVIQAVVKATMEPKNLGQPVNTNRQQRGRPTTPQPVSSKAITSLEDYLKEARRRRAMETQQPVLNSPPPAPARKEPEPLEVIPEMEPFKPVLIPAPAQERRTTPTPIPRAPKTPKKQNKPKPVPPIQSVPAPLVQSPQRLPASPPVEYRIPTMGVGGPLTKFTPGANRETALATLLAKSMRDSNSIAGAMILREILGPPASTRNRARRRA